MTVESPTNKTTPANGDGVTVDFPYADIKLIEPEQDLLVYIIDNTGALVLQTITTDYTLTYDDELENGTITFVTAPAADEQVFAIRERELTQPFDIPVNSDFDAEKIETTSDNLAIQISDGQEKIDRALKQQETFTGDFQVDSLPVDNNLLVFVGTDGTMTNSGTTLATLEAGATDAAASAAAAASSASAAASSASAAASSASDAATSASEAQAAVGGVRVSANDTMADNLEAKLLVDSNLSLSTQNEGGNETRTIGVVTPFGRVLQVVRDTTNGIINSSSSTYVSTGLSVTITPTATTSDIFLIARIRMQAVAVTTFTGVKVRFTRNTSSIREMTGVGNLSTNQVDSSEFYSDFDSPASVAALTYDLEFARNVGDGTVSATSTFTNEWELYAIEIGA